MKISLNWLSDYVDVNTDPMELAAILTRAGIEVEEIDSSATVPAGVVTAKILSRDPHPNSDHLSICKVDPGNGEPVQIVCGAPNCDAGNVVPLATLGTVFKDPDGGKDFVIKPSKLRGVESFGMMCSARELGLSNDHDGLMIFPADTALGQAVDKMYPGETIFNLELTQNRPDWLSHWGIARDVSALCDGILRFPNISLPEPEVTESFENLVKVEAADLCPKYTARVI
ncbi:MAG: phenylalanine--tRNA ligase subunit beta, partial [Lentisphaerae bacterium]|nr:phenylalanine--tRNA ligase subunit beta [Lentisphaerota bacterium]